MVKGLEFETFCCRCTFLCFNPFRAAPGRAANEFLPSGKATEPLLTGSSQKVAGNPSKVLAGTTIAFFLASASMALFKPMFDQVRSKLDLGDTDGTFALAVPALTGCILQVPFAAAADRNGGQPSFLTVLILCFIGMCGQLALLLDADRLKHTAFVGYTLTFLGVLMGTGMALLAVGSAQLAYWFPRRTHGRALAWFVGIGNLGPTLASYALPSALQILSFTETYFLALLLLLFGLLVYCLSGQNASFFQLLKRGTPAAQAESIAEHDFGQDSFPSSQRTIFLAASARMTWVLTIAYFLCFGGIFALTTYFPNYWMNAHGLETAHAVQLSAQFCLCAMFVRIPAGFVVDCVGGRQLLLAGLLFIIAGSAVLSWSKDYNVLIVAQFTLAAAMGLSNAAIFKLIPEQVPDAIGAAFGWISGLGAAGGFFIPPLLAFASTQLPVQGRSLEMLCFSGLALLSFILLACSKRRPRRVANGERYDYDDV